MTDATAIQQKFQEICERVIEQGLTKGMQVYISRSGDVLFNAAFGETKDNVEATVHHLFPWHCLSKPVAALAMLSLLDDHGIDDTTPVIDLAKLPDTVDRTLTVRHVLTHKVGGNLVDAIIVGNRDQVHDIVSKSAAYTLPDGDAHYSLYYNWWLLDYVAAAVGDVSLQDLVQERIFPDFGMSSSTFDIGSEVDEMHVSPSYTLQPDGGFSIQFDNRKLQSPGSIGYGPAAEYGRFLEYAGELSRATIQRSSSMRRMRSVHRSGDKCPMYGNASWGLGFCVGGRAFARDFSISAFGHDGFRSTVAVADPEIETVMVVFMNTMCDAATATMRSRGLLNRFYKAISQPVQLGSTLS